MAVAAVVEESELVEVGVGVRVVLSVREGVRVGVGVCEGLLEGERLGVASECAVGGPSGGAGRGVETGQEGRRLDRAPGGRGGDVIVAEFRQSTIINEHCCHEFKKS